MIYPATKKQEEWIPAQLPKTHSLKHSWSAEDGNDEDLDTLNKCLQPDLIYPHPKEGTKKKKKKKE